MKSYLGLKSHPPVTAGLSATVLLSGIAGFEVRDEPDSNTLRLANGSGEFPILGVVEDIYREQYAEYASRIASEAAKSSDEVKKLNAISQEVLLKHLTDALLEIMIKSRVQDDRLIGHQENREQWILEKYTVVAEALIHLIVSRIRIERLTIEDPLTKLLNRKGFDDNLKTAIDSNERSNDRIFSLLILDIDHFKKINDKYGHPAGDLVLKELAYRLKHRAGLRKLDIVTRYGGEEFAVILPDTVEEGACIVAGHLSDIVASEYFQIEDSSLPVTVSIGVAQYQSHAEDPKGKIIVRKADDNLYILKGEKADEEGVKRSRRGGIACGGRVITEEMLRAYRIKMNPAALSVVS